MKRPVYQNFYKLQMAMNGSDDNVLIFGPAASGKCDALALCISHFSKLGDVAVFSNKTALMIEAYDHDNVRCYNWDPSMLRLKPEWIIGEHDVIIIDGYCTNWKELIERHPNVRFIMAMRADSQGNIPHELKQNFRIIAKSGWINLPDKIKGITSIRSYKG